MRPGVFKRLLLMLPALLMSASLFAQSYVGGTADETTNGGNLSLDISGLGLQQDDVGVVCDSQASSGDTDLDMTTVMSSSGWTPLTMTEIYANSVRETNFWGWYKVMGVTPDTSVELTGSGVGNSQHAASVQFFRGVNTPTDVAVVQSTSTSTGIPNAGAITHGGPSGTIVGFCAGNAHQTSPSNFTGPTNYTTNFLSTAYDGETNRTSIAQGYNTSPSSTEDPAAVGWDGTDGTAYSYAAYTYALWTPTSGVGGSPFNGPFKGPTGGPL